MISLYIIFEKQVRCMRCQVLLRTRRALTGARRRSFSDRCRVMAGCTDHQQAPAASTAFSERTAILTHLRATADYAPRNQICGGGCPFWQQAGAADSK